MGMVILMAATLQDVNNCYNLRNGSINHKEIDRRLHVVGQRYSSGLENCLREILCEMEDKRPDWISLKNIKGGGHKDVVVHTSTHSTPKIDHHSYERVP